MYNAVITQNKSGRTVKMPIHVAGRLIKVAHKSFPATRLRALPSPAKRQY